MYFGMAASAVQWWWWRWPFQNGKKHIMEKRPPADLYIYTLFLFGLLLCFATQFERNFSRLNLLISNYYEHYYQCKDYDNNHNDNNDYYNIIILYVFFYMYNIVAISFISRCFRCCLSLFFLVFKYSS